MLFNACQSLPTAISPGVCSPTAGKQAELCLPASPAVQWGPQPYHFTGVLRLLPELVHIVSAYKVPGSQYKHSNAGYCQFHWENVIKELNMTSGKKVWANQTSKQEGGHKTTNTLFNNGRHFIIIFLNHLSTFQLLVEIKCKTSSLLN